MEVKINIISRESIKPSSPTPPEKKNLKLSFFDQIQPLYYIRLLFFYETKKPANTVDDPSKKTLELKQSLSESLTKFYPLAGRLSSDNLSVDCDDSGVLFVEAKVDAPLSEAVFKQTVADTLPFEPFVFGNDDEHGPKHQFLLGVQLTWFECGSNIIAVSFSHKIADLISFITFMNHWATLNRGETSNLKPNFDVGVNLFSPLEDHDFNLHRVEMNRKILRKKLVFNKEKLIELKQLATSSSSSSSSLSSVKDPSRVEVVTAFIWKHLINAERRAHHPAGGTTAVKPLKKILHAVNLRSRMSSLADLSSNSNDDEFPFGNMVVTVAASFFATSDDDDENKAGRDYYGDLVRLTREAIRKVNDDYVFNCAIPFLQNLMTNRTGGGATQKKPMTITMGDIMHFTSWCRFPMYEVHFGWGKPFSVCPASDASVPGVILKDTKDGEGMEAWINVLEDEFTLLPNPDEGSLLIP